MDNLVLKGGVAKALNDSKRAFYLAVTHPLSLIFCVWLDALFFIVYGFLRTPIRDSIVSHGILIGELLSEASKAFAQTRQSSPGLIELILTLPEIRPWLIRLGLLFALLVATFFVLYLVFQGTAWKLAHDAVQQKTGYLSFMGSFAKSSIVWIALFGANDLFSFIIDLRKTVIERLGQSSEVGGIIVQILFLLILAGTLWTSALTARTAKPVRTAITTIWKTPAIYFIITGIALYLLNFALDAAGEVSFSLQVLIGFAVLLPMFFVIRVYLNLASNDLHQ